MTYSAEVSHASARINTHKPMLWCEELSVYWAKLSVDWHRLPEMSYIMLGSHYYRESYTEILISASDFSNWIFGQIFFWDILAEYQVLITTDSHFNTNWNHLNHYLHWRNQIFDQLRFDKFLKLIIWWL